jgi:hypothetical protein
MDDRPRYSIAETRDARRALVVAASATALALASLALVSDSSLAGGLFLSCVLIGLLAIERLSPRAYFAFLFSSWSSVVFAIAIAVPLYLVLGLGPNDVWFWVVVVLVAGYGIVIEIAGRLLAARRGEDWSGAKRELVERMAQWRRGARRDG